MKNIPYTILCLTLISIVALFTGDGIVPIILWIGYGIYKLDNRD